MRLKVCGLTNPADARHAVACGADLLGFVVHPPSPRHCPDLVGLLSSPPNLCGDENAVRERAVLVTVGEDADLMLDLARRAGIGHIQPHVPASRRQDVVSSLRRAGFYVLLPWSDAPDQEIVEADLYLWEPDPARTGVAGGAGLTHAMAHPPPGPFLLAGGLDATNLAERAARIPVRARPNLRGFDAASKLEASPGLKDSEKVRAYVSAARLF